MSALCKWWSPQTTVIFFTLLLILGLCNNTVTGQTLAPGRMSTDSSDDLPIRNRLITRSDVENALSDLKFDDAEEYAQTMYRQAKASNKQPDIYESMSDMAAVYESKGDYQNMFDYAQQLYLIAINSSNKWWNARSLQLLARVHNAIEEQGIAINYYARAIAMGPSYSGKAEIDSQFNFDLQLGIASAYARSNQFDQAWQVYELHIPLQYHRNFEYLMGTSECLQSSLRFQAALARMHEAESLKPETRVEILRVWLGMAECYVSLDSPKLALLYARKALTIAAPASANQQLIRSFKVCSDAFDELHHVDSADYYFRIYAVAKDVATGRQTRTKIATANYEQRINIIRQGKALEEIRLHQALLYTYFLIAGIFMVIISAFLIIRSLAAKRIYERKKHALDLQIQTLATERATAVLLQQKSELEMKALRAQMNPHFIFNCLNAIGHFIIRNSTAEATDYLAKFAKLIRIVLEKSNKLIISLEDELAYLKLYMDLEAIRFERPFSYKVVYDNFDPADTMVPSMLIQPFIENAIWHGLYPQQHVQGKIEITFKKENDILHCIIIDNGIGITRAQIMKEKRAYHNSYGIGIATGIIQGRSESAKKPGSVVISEIKDNYGNCSGTLVHLCISIS